jgi:gephyrin
MPFRVFVLTVSDTASQNASTDKSGPLIQELLGDKQQNGRYEVLKTKVVPDDVEQISTTVKSIAESGEYDWIVTTGGTGFGVRDKTPEAITPLIERPASGIVHLLLSSSIQHTTMAALSRPVAGTIKNTLVVTLPGSPKAVKENLTALLEGGVVFHALELITGGDSRTIHKILGVDERVVNSKEKVDNEPVPPPEVTAHHCHVENRPPKAKTLRSNDPSRGASSRARESPFPMIPLADAVKIVLDEAKPLGIVTRTVNSSLSGCILAEDVIAPYNFPPAETSRVDGYALRATDKPGRYKVVTPHTHKLDEPVPEGTVYRINTGSFMPAGVDSVIMVEDTRLVSSYTTEDDEEEEAEIDTLIQVDVGENVRRPGSDVKQGERVLAKGDVIASTGGEVGTLTFVSRKTAQVFRKPVVAVLSTGNEVYDLHTTTGLEEGKPRVWDTNRPSLKAALTGMGYEVIDLGVVKDEIPAHVEALKKGLAEADIVLTTGGSSMGSSDLLKPVLERYLGGTIHFGRVNVKPGKPTTFATIPQGEGVDHKLVFALPGNPAAAVVTFYLFVIPALRRLGGYPQDQCKLPRVKVQLLEDMLLDSRPGYYRAYVRTTPKGLTATSTGGQCSSRVGSLAGANGFVELPSRKETEKAIVAAGDWADAILIGEIMGPGSGTAGPVGEYRIC